MAGIAQVLVDLMPPAESIKLTDAEIMLGSSERHIRAYRVRAGRMRAVLMVGDYLGSAEAFVTQEEARALGKWLTRRVRQSDRENRRERLRKLIRFDFCQPKRPHEREIVPNMQFDYQRAVQEALTEPGKISAAYSSFWSY